MDELKNLNVPKGKIDVVLDTDAYNEIDDQFAISFLLASNEKLNTVAIYAAPFHNERSTGPKDGMEKSYKEIFKLLDLIGVEKPVFKGSEEYLKNEETFLESQAARDLVQRAKKYSPENPLYVVAIGAITNIASALIIDPSIGDNIVVVWLGGHARSMPDTKEFNMFQDYAAARVVMGSSAPFVQAPCRGVVSDFQVSGPEVKAWFENKGKVSDYLAKNTLEQVAGYIDVNRVWTRVLWDVVAVAWLLNDDEQFMETEIVNVKLPSYDGIYEEKELDKKMVYINSVKRNQLLQNLIDKVTAL